MFNLILIKVARGTAIQPLPDDVHTVLQFRRHTVTEVEMGDFGTGTTDVRSITGDVFPIK